MEVNVSELESGDHRLIGKELDLFHIQEEAIGSVFWHPNGYTLFRTIENYIREKVRKDGYREVKTPQMMDRKLWEASGHWAKYRENMFVVEQNEEVVHSPDCVRYMDDGKGGDYAEFCNCATTPSYLAIKPMNCPGHVQIFNQGITSYKDLPIRLAEFGACHRNEPSGSLLGLMRVRAFTQDDAHIFCTEDQINDESVKFCNLLLSVYRDFGFNDVSVKLSTRPAARAGSDEIWDKAEKGLADAASAAGLTVELQPGEGAFYGPKLEFTLTDKRGRQWQCGTLQLDLVLPERLGASYVTTEGTSAHPVMLHRAILGSVERFMGILLEHDEGKLPFWLCPVQVGIVPVNEAHHQYAKNLMEQLDNEGVRVEMNSDASHFNKRMKGYLGKRVPVVIIVGDKEKNDYNATLRYRDGTQKTMALRSAVDTLVKQNRPGR
jgi:threonyl-tRNA synthetase